MDSKIIRGPNFEPKLPRKCLGEILFDNLHKFGDRIFQIDADVDEKETYKSVFERSVKAASALLEKGVSAKDTIVFCSSNTLDNAIPILGAIFIGAKIANLDPSLSAVQTKHLLSLIRAKIVFVEEDFVNTLEMSFDKLNYRSEVVVYGNSERYLTLEAFLKTKVHMEEFKPVEVNLSEESIVIFSSGTTGLPKGISYSQKNFLCMIQGMTLQNMLLNVTLYTVEALATFCNLILNGGTRVTTNDDNPEHLYKIIDKYRVDSILLSPTVVHYMTLTGPVKTYDTSCLRHFYIAGGIVSAPVIDKLMSIFKEAVIILVYGLSETGIISTTAIKPGSSKDKLNLGGHLAPGVALRVRDRQTGADMSAHAEGEICIKCPAMFTGYYQSESYDVFDADGFLKTGDIGYYDDNNLLYVVDRAKEIFKYMGWVIVPAIIESILLDHPEVKDAMIFGIPVNNEVGEMPAACVVLKPHSDLQEQELISYVEGKVSEKEKLRGGLRFVDDLPKTPSGKLMRRQIKNLMLVIFKNLNFEK